MLQHPALIQQVMKNQDLHKTKWFKSNPGTAVDRLIEALRIRTVADTNIIEVAVDPATTGDEAPTLVSSSAQ
jgi:hypothetical protein